MKKKVEFNINLIPKDPFFTSAIGKLLKWSLSVGRYIVIFTEVVVIISFLSRFRLDRQVTDLNSSIEQKKTIIMSYGDLEDDVRKTQDILEEYDQIRQQINITEVFPELTRIMPNQTELSELVISPKQVSLSGRAYNQGALNTLINNIQLSNSFSNVSVDRIQSSNEREGEGFAFVIRADTGTIAPSVAIKEEASKVNILDRTQGIDDF